MNFPPRLAHLATRAIVSAKLLPTYAAAHQLDDDDALARLDSALKGSLLDELLSAAWATLWEKARSKDEAALLEKIAGALKDRPMRPGRTAKLSPAWSAFLVRADLEAGTASEATRRVMETPQARQKLSEGIAEAGRFLAAELTRSH